LGKGQGAEASRTEPSIFNKYTTVPYTGKATKLISKYKLLKTLQKFQRKIWLCHCEFV